MSAVPNAASDAVRNVVQITLVNNGVSYAVHIAVGNVVHECSA